MLSTPEYPPGSPSEFGLTGSPGFRLFSRQPKAMWLETGTDANGRPTWALDRPASGVALYSLRSLPMVLSLPGGFTVELAREEVPEENRLGIFFVGIPAYKWWIDVCLVLRIRRDGVVVEERRRQWEIHGESLVLMSAIPNALSYSLSAGLVVGEDGELQLYAHAFDLPQNNDVMAVESSPSIPGTVLYGRRLAGPFGRGISALVSAAGIESPIGPIGLTAEYQDYYDSLPAQSWFAHHTPLEDRLPLVPDAAAIADRPDDHIAWGRHRAQVAAMPLAWGMTDLEAQGHPEWVLKDGDVYHPEPLAYHPGASRLFDRGRPAAVIPASATRSNVSASAATNQLLTTLRASWSITAPIPFSSNYATFATGPRDIGLSSFGAWNEYRPPAWLPAGAATNTSSTGEAMPGTIEGVFLAVSLSRVDATNLGGIADKADAVQVTRYVVRWFVAAKTLVTSPSTGQPTLSYSTWVGVAMLSEADGLALLAGNQITIPGDYMQGTYPTPTATNRLGTFTLQAVG
jgi:hypothetical protein